MNRRSRKGFFFAALLILLVLMISIGGWFFVRSRSITSQVSEKPILIDFLQPSSGQDLKLGDTMQVTVQSVCTATSSP